MRVIGLEAQNAAVHAGALPNLLVIGAAKAGTSSFHAYVGQHPSVSMSDPKELNYFCSDGWEERTDWYGAHFDGRKPIRGESSVRYSMWPWIGPVPDIPERASRVLPAARIIYLVRDPIERMASHWRQRVSQHWRGPAPPWEWYASQLEDPENEIACASRYATQLERWMRHYDSAQILVVDQRDLSLRRVEVMDEVFEFLGLWPCAADLDLAIELNTRDERFTLRRWSSPMFASVLWPLARRVPEAGRRAIRGPANRLVFRPVTEDAPLTNRAKARLEEHFKPEMERFRELTGRPFDHWQV